MRGSREEVRLLMAKAGRYIRSARVLIQDGDHDSAVSRTYYAMFYGAQALLLAEGLSFSSHKAVIAAFGKRFVKTGKLSPGLHRDLLSAFEKRQLGDYESRICTNEETAAGELARAENFLDHVRRRLKMSQG